MINQMGGMPPQPPTGAPAPNDAISQNRSVMNPIDMAAMAQDGTVKPDMTVKDLIEKVFKVPIDAPVQALVEAIKRQSANRTGLGKVGAMGRPPVGSAMGPRDGSGHNGAMAPPSRPPMPTQGISDLMGGR